MISTYLDRMVPLVLDSQESHMKSHRREMSSDSTISAKSVDDFSNALSSTPTTSIGESVYESTSINIENTPARCSVQTSVCYRTRARRTLSTYDAKFLDRTEIHIPEKIPTESRPPKDHERSVVENSGPSFPQNLSILPPTTTTTTSITTTTTTNTNTTTTAAATSDTAGPKKRTRKSFHLTQKKSDSRITPSRLSNSKISRSGQNTRKDMDECKSEGEKRCTRSSRGRIGAVINNLSILGKRSRKSFKDGSVGSTKMSRELKKLADTNEFAKIDTVPVLHEIWSNGKFVDDDRPPKKNKLQEREALQKPLDESNVPYRSNVQVRMKKVWLTKGLYAGQKSHLDQFELVSATKRSETHSTPLNHPRNIFPLPMWHGRRLIEIGRDFKLPYDVCSPLPPGQPKPDEWRKTTKNRFVGEAGALWKVSKFLDSSSSKCVCNPETGCGEDCQNRIMFYECDDTNCASGPERCTNRAFAGLQERRKAGGKYRVGVEVIKTADRGYGVRSNRCFEPHQIIVEYTGEIITEEECDRRMREDYKDNDCHYLMSFDQSMIIDATKGSIARFINHSCKPNCRMVKWIVGGNPRMALFAGDEPIMTGDELTYDYNFDPFSTKNIQECRCGSNNCRGVLGPRPKDIKSAREVPKEGLKDILKNSLTGGKRKISEFKENDDHWNNQRSKKRKISDATDLKRSKPSSTGLKIVQSGIKSFKKNVSSKLQITSKSSASDKITKVTRHRSSMKSQNTGNNKNIIPPRKTNLARVNIRPRSKYTKILGSKKGSSPVKTKKR